VTEIMVLKVHSNTKGILAREEIKTKKED